MFLPLIAANTTDVVDVHKLGGQTVLNGNNASIGKVESVLLDKDGKAKYVVVGVGGFLGMGEREVALPWDALTISQNGEKVTANYSKEQLKAMREYRFADASRAGSW